MEDLQGTLTTAKAILAVLQQQAAGYTSLTIPAHLQVQLEDKRKEVASLEARLAQQSEARPAGVPDFLPRSVAFFGREAELARCLAALSPEERGWGVAIDGIGGMGKTALALETARLARREALFDAYLFVSAKTSILTPEGVRAATLADTSLDAFVREMARQLGCEDIETHPDPAERRRLLLDALHGRRTLSIWDNLETLTAEERELIAEFLRHLPGDNKAILTSRRRTGESALTLRLDRLAEKDAFALMDDLAGHQPHLAAGLQQAGEEPRRRLYALAGGNPLAIKWALGLVAQKGYPLAAALEHLQDAAKDLYAFLFRDAVESLDEPARAVLVAFTAFQTAANAAALADAAGLPPNQAALCLEKLLALSLVNESESGCYTLHPLTRNYVLATLGAGSELARGAVAGLKLDPVGRRTALGYWVDYAVRYGGGDKDAYRTYDRLAAEWANLEAAATELYALSGLPAALQDAEAARLLNDLAAALANFLWYRGLWEERVRIATWAYEAACSMDDGVNAGWRAQDVAFIHLQRGETDQADMWAGRCAQAGGRANLPSEQASTVQLRGLVAEQRGNLEDAERLYGEALAAYQKSGDEAGQARVFNDLGNIAYRRREYVRAEGYYRQALQIAERQGHVEYQATYSSNLANLALDRGRPVEARPWFERALSLAQQVGREDLIAHAQFGLARVLEEEKRYAKALPLAEESLHIRERLHHQDLSTTRDLVERLRRKASPA